MLKGATFNAAWADGRAMSMKQTIEYARKSPMYDGTPYDSLFVNARRL